METHGTNSLLLGDQRVLEAEMVGPLRVDIPGFSPVFICAYFLPPEPEHGRYLPILGYIPLELAKAAVDCFNQRLIEVPAELRRAG